MAGPGGRISAKLRISPYRGARAAAAGSRRKGNDMIGRAALAYFASVFAIGFALGTLRVLLVAPALGALPATLVELPLMIAAAWLACGGVLRRWPVAPDPGARLAVGALAFALLIGAELLLGRFGFGRDLAAQRAAMLRPEGLAGLAGQAVFALLPLVRRRVRGSRAPARP